MAAIAAVGMVAIIYGIVRIARGSRARGIVLIAAGLLLLAASTWKYRTDSEKQMIERQIDRHESQAPIEPYPED